MDVSAGLNMANVYKLLKSVTGQDTLFVRIEGRDYMEIYIENPGSGYNPNNPPTVTFSGAGGYGASATAVIDGRVGTIRTVYYDSLAQRQVVDENAGEIDYDAGIVTITNIAIKDVQSVDGDIRLSIEAEKGIINTSRNTIISIDQDDPTSISTTLETV